MTPLVAAGCLACLFFALFFIYLAIDTALN